MLVEGRELESNILRAEAKPMEVLHVEDLASHDDPESCVVIREGGSGALTGESVGRALSRVKLTFGMPALWRKGEGNISRQLRCVDHPWRIALGRVARL